MDCSAGNHDELERMSGVEEAADGRGGPAGTKKMKASDMLEYDELVSQLAERLKLARHPDPSVTIRAAQLLIERLVSASGGNSFKPKEADEEEKGASRMQRSKFSLDDVTLPRRVVAPPESIRLTEEGDDGMMIDITTTGEGASKKETKKEKEKDEPHDWLLPASKALKLLYLEDQRQLQFRVNEIISAIQAVTANPKTDPRLLATGR